MKVHGMQPSKKKITEMMNKVFGDEGEAWEWVDVQVAEQLTDGAFKVVRKKKRRVQNPFQLTIPYIDE